MMPFLKKQTHLLAAIFVLTAWQAFAGVEVQKEPSLSDQIIAAYRAGRFADALRLAELRAGKTKAELGETHPDYAMALTTIALLHEELGQNEQAEARYRQAVAALERSGASHALGKALLGLGKFLLDQGRLSDAEQPLQRALDILNEHTGPGWKAEDLVTAFNSMARLRSEQGRQEEAEAIFRHIISTIANAAGGDHPAMVTSLEGLGQLYGKAKKFAEAEEAFLRALRIQEQAGADEDRETGYILAHLGEIYANQPGRFGEAEKTLRRALEVLTKTRGSVHPDVIVVLTILSDLYLANSQPAAALDLLRQALAATEQRVGPDHPKTADLLLRLGNVYYEQAAYPSAEGIFNRALEIYEQKLGPEHPSVANALVNLGRSYLAEGRDDLVVNILGRAHRIRQKALGDEHPDTLSVAVTFAAALLSSDKGAAFAIIVLLQPTCRAIERLSGTNDAQTAACLNNLGLALLLQKRNDLAEPVLRKAAAISENLFGPEHPDTARALMNLAGAYEPDYRKAQPLMERAVGIYERALGDQHPKTAEALNNLGWMQISGRDWRSAYLTFVRATGIYVERTGMDSAAVAKDVIYRSKGELAQNVHAFMGRIEASYELARIDQARAADLARQTFGIAQWVVQGTAAAAVAQMSTRGAASNITLAGIARELQNLSLTEQGLERQLVERVSSHDTWGSSGNKSKSGEAWAAATSTLRQTLAQTRERIAALNERLRRDFPNYYALARPHAVSFEDTQALLRSNEALIQFVVSEQGVYAWVLSKEAPLRWVRISDDESSVVKTAAKLMQSLGAGVGARAIDKEESGKAARPSAVAVFDLAAAHELYRALIEPIVTDIENKRHLIIVPDGPLTGLPFQLLVASAATAQTTTKTAHWLIRDHAISVLPAVSSLRALRQLAPKTRTATLPFIGFGDPLIGGGADPDVCKSFAQLMPADEIDATPTRHATPPAPEIDERALPGGGFSEGGIAVADVDWLRGQPRLAESRCELETLARYKGADAEQTVFVGADATESKVKQLSARGELKNYQVVTFATHGLLPQEAKGVLEAGLILTPPAKGSADDDGLLTASEVADLDLDADWVILSACNTASGDKTGAETLSGLARAFFYAGARSLLVSHWPVNSRAAVLLTTRAFHEIEREPGIGKAEAIRRAMLSFLANDVPDAWSHPRIWASFALVGEGG
jgi:CHAT domain-containing protein/Tfp pilus assembly protein PilF